MSRIKRMSPALAVAILALIAALVVPAIAQVATKALTKREVVVVRKLSAFQANRAVTRRAPRIARFQANRQIARRLACPSGYIKVAGVCYEPSNRGSDDWGDASADCADENLTLPTVGQLRLAIDELGNIGGGGEWTDSLGDDGSPYAVVVNSFGDHGIGTGTHFYRCVTPLVR